MQCMHCSLRQGMRWSLGCLAGEMVNGLVGGLQAVLRFAKLHDDLLSAKDPVLTLRLAAAFCMLAILSNVFRCSRIVPCAPCPAA